MSFLNLLQVVNARILIDPKALHELFVAISVDLCKCNRFILGFYLDQSLLVLWLEMLAVTANTRQNQRAYQWGFVKKRTTEESAYFLIISSAVASVHSSTTLSDAASRRQEQRTSVTRLIFINGKK